MNDDNEERFLVLINARWLASETDDAADNNNSDNDDNQLIRK